MPGQMYPQQQMYMVADGTAAAGPIGMGSQPELYSKMVGVRNNRDAGNRAGTDVSSADVRRC